MPSLAETDGGTRQFCSPDCPATSSFAISYRHFVDTKVSLCSRGITLLAPSRLQAPQANNFHLHHVGTRQHTSAHVSKHQHGRSINGALQNKLGRPDLPSSPASGKPKQNRREEKRREENRTEENRTEQNRREENRREQKRTEENRREQKRTEQKRTEENRREHKTCPPPRTQANQS